MKNRTGISLRLTPDEREALEALKSYLGENTATRALLHVIRLYPSQHRALQATLAGTVTEIETMDTSRREALDLLRKAVAKKVDEKNFTGNPLLDDVFSEDC